MVEWVDQFEADQCYMDRSTYVSLGSFVCYLFLILCLTVSLVMPDYTHQLVREQRSGGTELDFDDVSMPSYLGSIGQSIDLASHTAGNTADSAKSSRNPRLIDDSVNQMASILEEGSCASDESSNNTEPTCKSSLYQRSVNSSGCSSSEGKSYLISE